MHEADITHLVVDGTFKSLQFGNYRGFRKLVTLELANLPLTDYGLRDLIFNVPLLQALCLRNSQSLEHIFIDAPNINHLVVDGIQSFEVGNSPNLVSAFISLQKVVKINGMISLHGLIKLLADSCKLEKLCIGGPFSKVFFKGFCIRQSFDNLRNLELSSIHLNNLDDFSSVKNTIQCFPKIEMLNISVTRTSNKCDQNMFKYSPGFILPNLRLAKVVFCNASSAEVKLVGFLLACSPALEKLFLGSSTPSYIEVVLMLKQVLLLPRASSKVDIIGLKNSRNQERGELS